MKILTVVAVALIDADGRVLIAQRPEGKALAGLWEFPGGKLDPGERPEAALIRELDEELGIAVKEACLAPLTFASHAYPDFHLLMPLWVCRRWEGQVVVARGPGAEMGAGRQAARLPDAARRRAADPAADRSPRPVTSVQPELGAHEGDLGRLDQPAMADPNRMQRAVELLPPEGQELGQGGKGGARS